MYIFRITNIYIYILSHASANLTVTQNKSHQYQASVIMIAPC